MSTFFPEKLPAVPCIAVKNEMLINDPDFPEASDHFCTPLTIEESNNRLKVTFERGFKRARMKMESGALDDQSPSAKQSNGGGRTASATCEINESTTNPINIDQYLWTKTSESASCLLIGDDTAQSSSSEASQRGADSSKRCASNGDAHSTSIGSHDGDDTETLELDVAAESDGENVEVSSERSQNHEHSRPATGCHSSSVSSTPRKRLDDLLRLAESRSQLSRMEKEKQHQRMAKTEVEERDKSTSPDENLNTVQSQQQACLQSVKMLENTANPASTFLSQLGVGAGSVNGAAANGFNLASFNAFFSQAMAANGGGQSVGADSNIFNNMQALAARLRGSELIKALNKPPKSSSPAASNLLQFSHSNNNSPATQALYNGAYSSSPSFMNGTNVLLNGISAHSPHMSEILNKYIKNNWDLPENGNCFECIA